MRLNKTGRESPYGRHRRSKEFRPASLARAGSFRFSERPGLKRIKEREREEDTIQHYLVF